ncbi:MAG TPA: hypothetical protein VHX44_18645 [Planctomycetota bacterium]|nr:hypothetical protein [Planctomycetota bacterium]
MVSLLFYEPVQEGPRLELDEVADALNQPGVELNGDQKYRSGRWRDVETGATCQIDLGYPPIEEDHLHPPRAYDGWRDVGLTVNIPLSGPHWLCVEALQWVEGLLARLPTLRTLDTEDTRQDHGEGPGAWSRPRALANWERLHHVQHEGRTDLWRMARLPSVCLWRYRRERAMARSAITDLQWPDALVLLDQQDRCARSAVLWRDPSVPIALPPVELVVIPRGASSGVITAEALSALGGAPLPLAQGQRLTPTQATADLFANVALLPATRFKALGDYDWGD